MWFSLAGEMNERKDAEFLADVHVHEQAVGADVVAAAVDAGALPVVENFVDRFAATNVAATPTTFRQFPGVGKLDERAAQTYLAAAAAAAVPSPEALELELAAAAGRDMDKRIVVVLDNEIVQRREEVSKTDATLQSASPAQLLGHAPPNFAAPGLVKIDESSAVAELMETARSADNTLYDILLCFVNDCAWKQNLRSAHDHK